MGYIFFSSVLHFGLVLGEKGSDGFRIAGRNVSFRGNLPSMNLEVNNVPSKNGYIRFHKTPNTTRTRASLIVPLSGMSWVC